MLDGTVAWGRQKLCVLFIGSSINDEVCLEDAKAPQETEAVELDHVPGGLVVVAGDVQREACCRTYRGDYQRSGHGSPSAADYPSVTRMFFTPLVGQLGAAGGLGDRAVEARTASG